MQSEFHRSRRVPRDVFEDFKPVDATRAGMPRRFAAVSDNCVAVPA
jgi:hypothetical protein